MRADVLTSREVTARVAGAQADIVRLGVRRLALFGSVRRDTARPDSDVDFLVEFAPGQKSYDRFFGLAELLEQLLNHSVELVTPESLSPSMRSHILRDAADVLPAA